MTLQDRLRAGETSEKRARLVLEARKTALFAAALPAERTVDEVVWAAREYEDYLLRDEVVR